MNAPRKAIYRGQAVDEMTRADLIEALTVMIMLNQRAHQDHQRTLDTWRKFQEARLP